MQNRKLPKDSKFKINGVHHGAISIDDAGKMTFTDRSVPQGPWQLKMCMDTGVIDKSPLENPHLKAGGVSYDQISGTIDTTSGGGHGTLHVYGTVITAASADWDAGAPPLESE